MGISACGKRPAGIHEGDGVFRLRLVRGVHGPSTLERESNTPPVRPTARGLESATRVPAPSVWQKPEHHSQPGSP